MSSVSAELPLAALLVQRHHLVLEGAAVNTSRGAVVFLGGSCAGKSSLSLAFALNGFLLMADGVVAIDLDGGKAAALPIPGPVEVSQDVLDALSVSPERVIRVREGLPRFCVSDVTFADGPVPVHAICLLGHKHDGLPEIGPVTGRSRVLSVLAHSFNRFLGEAPETRHRMLPDVTRTLQTVPVFRLVLPEHPLQLADAVVTVREACALG